MYGTFMTSRGIDFHIHKGLKNPVKLSGFPPLFIQKKCSFLFSETAVFIDTLEYFYFMPTAREIALEKENFELKSQVHSLQNQLEAVLKIMLGKKSEKRTDLFANQPSLFGDDIPSNQPEDTEEEKISYSRKKRKGNPVRKPLPDSLRREVVEIFPDNIPNGAIRIGQEETEVLEIIAAEVYVKRYVRYKYALPKEEGVIIGEMPKLPIHKSNAGASILSYLLIGKYLDHLPWYRQIQQFKRQGVELSDSTINNWFTGQRTLRSPQAVEEGKHLRGDV